MRLFRTIIIMFSLFGTLQYPFQSRSLQRVTNQEQRKARLTVSTRPKTEPHQMNICKSWLQKKNKGLILCMKRALFYTY